MVSEVPTISECKGPDAGVGPVLPCVQENIKAAASGIYGGGGGREGGGEGRLCTCVWPL